MFITCRRSGGVAGIRPVLTIDTDQLSDDEAARITDMIRRLPTRTKSPSGVDRFTYHIAVEHDGKSSEYWIGDGQNSPLINLLWDVATREQDTSTTKPPTV